MVRLVEKQAMVFLSTADSTHKVQRMFEGQELHIDVVIADEAGCVLEWKLPLLTRLNQSFQPRHHPRLHHQQQGAEGGSHHVLQGAAAAAAGTAW